MQDLTVTTMEGLRQALQDLHIPNWAYALQEVEDNRLCVLHNGASWEVFFLEKGQRFDEQTFFDAAEACRYVLDNLTRSFLKGV